MFTSALKSIAKPGYWYQGHLSEKVEQVSLCRAMMMFMMLVLPASPSYAEFCRPAMPSIPVEGEMSFRVCANVTEACILRSYAKDPYLLSGRACGADKLCRDRVKATVPGGVRRYFLKIRVNCAITEGKPAYERWAASQQARNILSTKDTNSVIGTLKGGGENKAPSSSKTGNSMPKS